MKNPLKPIMPYDYTWKSLDARYREYLRSFCSWGVPGIEPRYPCKEHPSMISRTNEQIARYRQALPQMTPSDWAARNNTLLPHDIGPSAPYKVPMKYVLPHLHPAIRERCRRVFNKPSKIILTHFLQPGIDIPGTQGIYGNVYTVPMDHPEWSWKKNATKDWVKLLTLTSQIGINETSNSIYSKFWLLRLVNGTPEPDGFYRVYWKRIPPFTGGHTGHPIAWLHDMYSQRTYAPKMRT